MHNEELSQLDSMAKIIGMTQTMIFISLLFIFILYKKYIYSSPILFMNFFDRRNTVYINKSNYAILKQTNIPIKIINNVGDKTTSSNILKYISFQDPNNFLIKKKIKKSPKIVLLIAGENGSGKTNLIFQLNTYFNDSHNIILATLDNYKRNYLEFSNMARSQKATYFTVANNVKNLKNLFDIYFDDFINTQYSMLIIDTSGRNENNLNLRNELVALINHAKNRCNSNNIDSIFLYNFSNLKTPFIPKNIHLYDYSVISQLSISTFNYEHFIKINKSHRLLFLSLSQNLHDLHLYSNILLADIIFNKIKSIINKK